MINKITLFTAIAFTALSTATAKVEEELYPFIKELKLNSESSRSSNFGSFEIDEEIFRSLDSKENNLRIIDANSAETPFLLRAKKGERKVTRQRAVPFEKLTFEKPAENQIEVELRRDSDTRYRSALISSIDISSSIKNFEKNVSVWSSDDRSRWYLIAENKPIFDYSKFIDIRNSRVSFAPSSASYFRIRISNISEMQESPFTRLSRTLEKGNELSTVESSTFTRADFKINEISFFEKTDEIIKGEILRQPYAASNLQVREEDKKSLVTFSTAGTPVTKISLLTTTPFFYRRYILETSTDGRTWQNAHAGVISSVNNEPESKDDRSIILPQPLRSANYRITVRNNDSPPLQITGIELEGETREVIFYCKPENTYSVIYGAGKATRPIYDIAEVLARAKSETTVQYTLSLQKRNPGFSETGKHRSILSRRTIMTISIILMIAVLGWLIAHTVKSIE